MTKQFLVFGIFFITACATTYELSFRPKQGETSYMKAAFHMKTDTYENSKLLDTQENRLSFGILSTIQKNRADGKIILQKKVIEKTGDYPLRQLGFPELGEKIEFTLDERGQVVHVKNEEPGSIFYLPFFIFPKAKVSVGERWHEEFQWNMLHHPFTVVTQVDSHFSSIEKCKTHSGSPLLPKAIGGDDLEGLDCYKIAFTTLSKTLPQSDTVTFDHSSQGHYLWDPQKNHILYAETHFLDTLTMKTGKNIVTRSEFTLEEKPQENHKK